MCIWKVNLSHDSDYVVNKLTVMLGKIGSSLAVWQVAAMASTAAGSVHRHAGAATVVGEEGEARRRHLVVGEEVRPAAVGHDDLERVAGQRRAGRID